MTRRSWTLCCTLVLLSLVIVACHEGAPTQAQLVPAAKSPLAAVGAPTANTQSCTCVYRVTGLSPIRDGGCDNVTYKKEDLACLPCNLINPPANGGSTDRTQMQNCLRYTTCDLFDRTTACTLSLTLVRDLVSCPKGASFLTCSAG